MHRAACADEEDCSEDGDKVGRSALSESLRSALSEPPPSESHPPFFFAILTEDDLRPYVHHVLGLYGQDRLMFGTDWPVCTLAGEYMDVTSTVQNILASLSPDAKADVFGGTATRFYDLVL